MKNYRFTLGIVILLIFLLNIGYQYQSFALATPSNSSQKNNSSKGKSQSTPSIVLDSSGKPHIVNTVNKNSQNIVIGNQEQRQSSWLYQNGGSTQSRLMGSSTVAVVNSLGTTYNTSWYNPDWNYRENITILPGKFSANETNFPLLLDIYSSSLKLALSNGYDIVFTEGNNSKLSYERISFNQSYSSTQAHLVVWVKGNYSTTGTTLMMYFGNPFSPDQQDPHGTWSNGYAAVYHLNGNPSGAIIDSTGHYNGTAYSGNSVMPSSDSVAGISGNGIYFDGNSNITLGNINSNSWTGLTIEAWINLTNNKGPSTILSKQNSSNTIWSLTLGSSSKFSGSIASDGLGGGTFSIPNFPTYKTSANTWYSLGLIWNTSKNILEPYFNGILQSGLTTTTNGTSLLNSNAIAGLGLNSFNGIIDEVRISSVTRSASWINDSNNNELNPKSFFTINSPIEKLQLLGNWSFNQLYYRKPITIAPTLVPQTFYNYTIPITLIDSDLHNHTQQNNNANDILFTDANGTRISQQIEQYTYNYAVNKSKLVVWLKLPVISNESDTVIYIYYGNSSVIRYDKSFNIWNGYSAVWHMSESSGSNIIDSSGNGYTATSNGNVPSTGQIGGGQSLNYNGYMSTSSTTLGSATDFMISGWFKLNNQFTPTSSKTQVLVTKYLNSTENLYVALIGTNNTAPLVPKGSLAFKIEQGSNYVYTYTNQTTWSANKWYKFDIIYHKNAPLTNKIYINGVDNTALNPSYVCSSCSISLGFTASWTLGGGYIDPLDIASNFAYFNGSLDEMRISNTVFNSSSINFNYLIEKNNPSLYSTGSEVYGDFSPPVINSFGVDDHRDGSAVFWARITDKSPIPSAYIQINNTAYKLASNGSYPFQIYTWPSLITYGNTYSFRIINATDSVGHTENGSATLLNYTFTKDILKPTVNSVNYYEFNGANGTFKANVTDSWPGIDRVEIHVVCSVLCPNPSYAIMQYNTSSGLYENNSLYMIGQSISYYVTAYDIGGNFFNTTFYPGTVRNKPPTVSNASLYTTTGYFFSDQNVLIKYIYSDPENATNNSKIYWYKNGLLVPSLNNSLYFPNSNFTIGDIIQANVTAFDGSNYGNTIQTPSITIVSTPPHVTASLANVTSSQNINAKFTYSDYDGFPLTYNITWYNSSKIVTSLNNYSIVDKSNIKKGESWYFKIEVSNGVNTTTKFSNTIIIQDTAPILTGTPRFTQANYTNSESVAINYTSLYFDYDGDLQNTTLGFGPIVKWYVNGTYNSTYDNLTVLSPSIHANDSYYFYQIWVFDGQKYSINYYSPTVGVTVGNFSDAHPPQIIGNVTIINQNGYACSNNCSTADTLYVNYTYYDADNNSQLGSLASWYEWNGTAGAWQLQSQYNNMFVIPNGTFLRNETWYVEVKVSDGTLLSLNSVNSGNITIADAPVILTVTGKIKTGTGNLIIVTNTTANNNIYAFWSYYDPDGDTVTKYEITWYNGTSNFTLLDNQNMLPYTYLKKNETWTISIRAFDGFLWSNYYNYSILIVDSAPVVSNLQLFGGVNVTTPISISYTYYDYDNDTNLTIITWYVNGTAYQTNDVNLTIPFYAGETVYVVITAYDGTLKGNTITSQKIIISDAIPSVNNVYIFQNNNTNYFYSNASLYVFFNATDPDTNPGYSLYTGVNYNKSGIGAYYKWYKNGILTSYTNYTIPMSALFKNDTWMVCVSPIDQALQVGSAVCSVVIIISNTPPVIKNLVWTNTFPATFQTVLTIDFSTMDYNTNDTLTQNITWYVNGFPVEYNNKTLANPANPANRIFSKNQNVTVLVSVYDGENLTLERLQIIISDIPPIASGVTLQNNNNSPVTYTTNDLYLYWSYYDADGDPQSTNWIIEWYMTYNFITFYNESALYPFLMNLTMVPSSYINKSQTWFASIRVFDGQDYSISTYNSTSIYISNSDPTLKSYYIDSPGQIIYTNNTLIANFTYYDADGDPLYSVSIFWYKNDVLQTNLDNMLSIPSNYTTKGESWYYKIKVFDGTGYSIVYTSPSIPIQDAPPYLSNVGLIFSNTTINPIPATRSFYLTDENISIQYIFNDIDGDHNYTAIYWYLDGVRQIDFTNHTTIPFMYLTNGSIWYFELIPGDGQLNGTIYISSLIYIYGAPYVSDKSYIVPAISQQQPEGIYIIDVDTNTTFEPVTQVTITLDPSLQNNTDVQSLINSLSVQTYNLANNGSDSWNSQEIDFFVNNRAEFAKLIGDTINIKITMYTEITDPVTHQVYKMWRIYYLSILIKDQSPPVVNHVSDTFNNLNNPTSITFLANVTDFGSGVQNVTIFYYFAPVGQSNTSLLNLNFKLMSFSANSTTMYSVQLLPIGNNQYEATVPFKGNSSITVVYFVKVFDKDGNFNSNAYPQREQTPLNFVYKPTGVSSNLFIYAILIILIIASFVTYVGIRKFRKTEIVGLDVDKVMNEANKIKDNEVSTFLNSHTLGIVISIFHQVHGPLPIFALPTILTDNLEKLIDLSDRSFSAVRFVDNFTSEMQITFDYSISSSLKIASLSYGFSLERPEARGGAENITLNIMLHKPYDTIINQFIPQLDPYVHEIHTILDKDEENKELVEKKVEFMRNLVSKIILAYQKIYPEGVEIEEDSMDIK